MTERQQRVIDALERAPRLPYAERQSELASALGGIGELGRGGQLDELAGLIVDPDLLHGWIADRRDELQLGSGEDLYLSRAARYRSELAFLAEITEIPGYLTLAADAFDEKILATWRDDGVISVPDGTPESHWWYFPPQHGTTAPTGWVAVSSADCDGVRQVANSLRAESAQILGVLIRNRFYEIAPDERPRTGDPGAILTDRLREAVAGGVCRVERRGARVDVIFVDRRLEMTVDVSDGQASFGWFEPRARVALDPAIGPLAESLELLERAAATPGFLERRLSVFELFDRLGSIGRYRPRDEWAASRSAFIETIGRVSFQVASAWLARCDLRLSDRFEGRFDGQQIREDRTVLAFLEELVADSEVREQFDSEIYVEGWDDDLRHALRKAEPCPVPDGTPESHWWWWRG